MDFDLRQRGRASLDFLSAFGAALGETRRSVASELTARGIDAGRLPEDFDRRLEAFEAALQEAPSYPRYAGMRAWFSRNHGPIAMESFEEIRDRLAPQLEALQTKGPATLERTLGDRLPAYFHAVTFHGTGAWDAHDYMGFVHGELVHRKLVARNFGGDIYAQRRAALEALERDRYARILELGTSSGNFTLALAQRFPDARITGVDLSVRMLEQAQRIANEHGLAWRLYQRAAESTGFADGSFDLVAGYALGHEVPATTLRTILAEAFRVLAPGGEILLADVVPFLAQDRLAQCWAQHEADYGFEPYWGEFSSLDLAELAAAAGFADARYFGIGERKHPFVLHARKPGAPEAARRER